MVSKSMLDSLLKRQLTHEPEPQPYFGFRDGGWKAISSSSPATASHSSSNGAGSVINKLRVITWNIDFMASQPRARMAAALAYLEQFVSEIPASHAVVIQLQEMMESQDLDEEENASDLSQLRNAPWVQQRFHLTDIDSSNFNAPYGQVTLVDRRLTTSSVSRLRFVSEYQRDALFVDVCVKTSTNATDEEAKYLRLCNVHLDSSYGSLRPVQWKALQQHLQNKEPSIVASIVAGDCNATQPRDTTAAQENGFKDAYCELGGTEGDATGATWGYQSIDGKRWGVQRLDKIVYWGDIEVDMLERIGIGVQVEDEKARKALEDDEELTFATDHYGLVGGFTVKKGLKATGNEHSGEEANHNGQNGSGNGT